ncbi:hypothetical protein LTR70_007962 [Exophiala xenobiotica]|uniref:F-box protein n=1 Tax=Lithohypha guttulata TaxID=1690604 RepID=A0ABR0K1N9_9EURO|nr:hypothetical protein LTR24_007808 [Lithohypha guttulata]KAK5312796.1 hypothetical protein LTR70_007962 [Exophiala xenobiotica]
MMERTTSSSGGQLPGHKQPTAIQLKSSAAQDNMQPSLIKLGRDILIMVFDLLQETSAGSLQAVASVSTEFYHLAEHSRHRHLTLDLEPSTIEASLNRLHHLEKQELLAAVRFLDVSNPGEFLFKHRECKNIDQHSECMNSISTLIPRMTGLRDVCWNFLPYRVGAVSIQITVLEALRFHHRVRLHAMVDTSFSPNYDGPYGQGRLKRDIECPSATDCLKATRRLKRILLSAPNIRSVSLNISRRRSHECECEYYGFGFEGDEKLPPLEELVVSEYPWGDESGLMLSSFSGGLRKTGYPGKGSEMDYWAESFDWSRLKRLETSYIALALRMMPKLTSLKEVNFSGSRSNDAILRFYQQCPAALEAIAAEGLQSITLDGLLKYSRSLRKLQLHTCESREGKWAETALDAASLRSIRDGCPLIEQLLVDVPRDGDWPWDVLNVLASFPRLRHLTLCFELGLHCKDDPVKPYVTFATADTLYTYLRSRSPKQPSILSHLHIYSGAPPPLKATGFLALEAYWPIHNSTEFICTLSKRDDEAARGVFHVECPKLPKGVLPSEDESLLGDDSDEDEKDAWQVAHQGPTPVSKWLARRRPTW